MTVLDNTQELYRPEELNGTLFTLLLPLAGPDLSLDAGLEQRGLTLRRIPSCTRGPTSRLHREARQWTEGGAGRYWAWPQAVLLADTRRDLETASGLRPVDVDSR